MNKSKKRKQSVNQEFDLSSILPGKKKSSPYTYYERLGSEQ
jgi:hypothetical protein